MKTTVFFAMIGLVLAGGCMTAPQVSESENSGETTYERVTLPDGTIKETTTYHNKARSTGNGAAVVPYNGGTWHTSGNWSWGTSGGGSQAGVSQSPSGQEFQGLLPQLPPRQR